jgi:hypothetical protein
MGIETAKGIVDDYRKMPNLGLSPIRSTPPVRNCLQVSLEETLSLSRKSSVVSRRSSSSINLGREEKVPADDKITLDQERYQMYEELKKKPAVQSQLANYIFHVKS